MASGLPASLVFGPPKHSAQAGGKNSPGQTAKTSKPKADAEAWRAEYERVKGSLVITAEGDEWRTDLEHGKSLLQRLSAAAAEARTGLEGACQGLPAKLQQLDELEAVANSELQGSREEIAKLDRRLAALQREHDSRRETVAELHQELAFLNREMEERRQQLEEQGDSVSSAKPVAQLRKAVASLREELVQMDVRVGVLQHLMLVRGAATAAVAGT